MRFTIGVLSLGLVLAGSTRADDDAAKKDLEKLAGKWTVVSAEQNGEPLDRIKNGTLEIVAKDGSFTIKTASGSELKGTITLDPTTKPKQADLYHTEGVLKDKTWKAIYDLDGDTLKLCYLDADSTKERPKEFKAAKDSECLLVVVERVKK
jgi:uncharacterized protein (TIGR03067 family)